LGATTIQKFLREQDYFSADFSDFLKNADIFEMFTKVIRPFRFETSLDGIEGVEDEIRSRLVLLGEIYRVPPTDAEKAIDALLSAAWRIATRESNRLLDRALLLKTFEQYTQLTVPRADVEQSAQVAGMLKRVEAHLSGDGKNALPIIAAQTIFSPMPPLPRRYLHRPVVQEKIDVALRRSGIAVISGPIRIGKTTSVLNLRLHKGMPLLWLDLSIRKGVDVIDFLRRAAEELSVRNDFGGVVVDGLPDAPAIDASLGRALAALFDRVHSTAGVFALTTSHKMSTILSDAASFPNGDTIILEPFRAWKRRRGFDPLAAVRN
jgi:hypothetical protein